MLEQEPQGKRDTGPTFKESDQELQDLARQQVDAITAEQREGAERAGDFTVDAAIEIAEESERELDEDDDRIKAVHRNGIKGITLAVVGSAVIAVGERYAESKGIHTPPMPELEAIWNSVVTTYIFAKNRKHMIEPGEEESIEEDQ